MRSKRCYLESVPDAQNDRSEKGSPMPPSLHTSHFLPLTSYCGHAVKLLPHPHPPVAFGLLKVKPEPCIDVT